MIHNQYLRKRQSIAQYALKNTKYIEETGQAPEVGGGGRGPGAKGVPMLPPPLPPPAPLPPPDMLPLPLPPMPLNNNHALPPLPLSPPLPPPPAMNQEGIYY